MPDVLQSLSEFPPRAKLTDSVHRVLGMNPTPFTGPGTNTYLVGMDGGAPLLIDTGAGVPDWLGLLKQQQAAHDAAPLSRCLLTHGHPDHVGGVRQLREWLPELPLHKRAWPERDADARYQPIADGDTFAGQGYTLQAIHTPGHAPDHHCFYLAEERALFTGDVILGVGTTVIPRDGGDLGQYLDSLRRLLALDLARIYPGHGPIITEPHAKIEQYLEHRLARERQILDELVDGPHTVPALVARIYADYPAYLHAAAGQSVRSHLDKLVAEQRVGYDEADEPRFYLMD